MGRYITESDLYAAKGQANVLEWATLDDGSSSPTPAERITAAIDYAEGMLDDQFAGGPYVVPLSLGTRSLQVVKTMLATLAAEWLFACRSERKGETASDRLLAQVDRVRETCAEYLSGQRQLDAVKVGTSPQCPQVVTDYDATR